MFPFLFNKNQFKSRKVKSQEKNLRVGFKFYEIFDLCFDGFAKLMVEEMVWRWFQENLARKQARCSVHRVSAFYNCRRIFDWTADCLVAQFDFCACFCGILLCPILEQVPWSFL